MNTKVWQTLAAVAIASVAIAGSAHAATFTIYGNGNTGGLGTGNNGQDTVSHTPDPSFTLVSSVAGTGFNSGQSAGTVEVTNGYVGYVPQQPGVATWIAPVGPDPSGNNDYYIYQETFDLPVGFTAATIAGEVTGDDYVEDIILNGNTIASFSHGEDGYTVAGALSNGSFSESNINDFNVGLNTLDFIVPNANGGSALFAAVSGTYTASVVPEPSTVAVYMVGSLALLGFVVRKKRIS